MLKQPTELILITHLRKYLIEISVSTVFIHRLICVSVNEGFLIGEFTLTQIICARGKHSVSVFRRLSVTQVNVHNVHIHLTNSHSRFRIKCVKVLIKSYFKLQILQLHHSATSNPLSIFSESFQLDINKSSVMPQ